MWVVVTVIVLFVGLVLFLGRSWLRMSVAPRVVTTTNGGNPAEKAQKAEAKRLQDPLQQLGFSNSAVTLSSCSTIFAEGPTTEVTCNYSQQASRPFPRSDQESRSIEKSAQAFQDKLEQNGWQLAKYTNTYYTLATFATNLNVNMDLATQVSYEKTVDGSVCYLNAFLEFDEPVVATGWGAGFSCIRKVHFFGHGPY